MNSSSLYDNDELFNQALRSLEAENQSKAPQVIPEAPQEAQLEAEPQADEKGFIEQGLDAWQSVGAGIGNALIETKDFIFGEPEEDEKSPLRKDWEATSNRLKSESVVNSVSMGVGQITTGLIGAGKLLAPLKALKAVKGGKAALEVGKGAIAGAVVVDPHEERLSDLIEEFPALQNPVTEYLSADPEDSAAEGRFKNALEGIGVDLMLISAVKAIKYLKAGNQQAALTEINKLESRKQTSSVNQAANATELEAVPGAGIKSSADELPLSASDNAIGAGQSPSGLSDAKPASAAPGAYTPGIEVDEASLSSILKSTEDDMKAISQFGSREDAREAGHLFRSDISLPWQKLRGTEDVNTFINNAASVLKNQMDTVKGGDTLSDMKLSQMVEARSALFGDDPLMVMGDIAKAGDQASQMVAEMEASYLIANRMFQESYQLAFKMRHGMLDEFGGDASKAAAELKLRLTASADLLASARSISSNSGRALRRMRGQHQFAVKELEAIKHLDGDKLAELLYTTKGDPAKIAQVSNPSFLRRVLDEGAFSLTNSLLWLWPTHVVNLTSNALMMIGRPTEKLLGALALGPAQGGNILRDQALREYAYTMSSLGDGWQAMVDAFKRGDSILSPHGSELFNAGSSPRISQQPLTWKPVNNISDMVENAWMSANYRNIVGLPTRALGAADEFFKTIRYRSYVQAEAASEAVRRGYKGAQLRSYVQAELEKAIDPTSGQALNPKALRESQVTTFQNELLSGTVGATIQNARAKHPILTFVLPFVKTPVNVLRYGWKMTPGLNLVQKEYRDAIKGLAGEEAKAHAVGQMVLGSVFMGLSASLALSGRITGGGPKNPEIQKELRASGWQPYSFVIEDEQGNKSYIPIGRLDPSGMAFSMVADLVDSFKAGGNQAQIEAGIGALGMALAKGFTDRTFLQNIHQALEALSDPSGKRGEKYLSSLAGNTIPLSSALRGANPDPYLREARGFIDNMLKNMPGYSETLPAQRNVFGEPTWREVGILSDSDGDLVEAEHNRIMLETGKWIGKPSPEFEGVDLRDITLKSGRNAYDRLQELSGQIPKTKSLKQYLAEAIKSPVYQDLPDGDPGVKGTRLNRLGVIVGKYRDKARKFLIQENQELRPLIKARQREAIGAYQANRRERQAQEGNASRLLDALGN